MVIPDSHEHSGWSSVYIIAVKLQREVKLGMTYFKEMNYKGRSIQIDWVVTDKVRSIQGRVSNHGWQIIVDGKHITDSFVLMTGLTQSDVLNHVKSQIDGSLSHTS